MWQADKIQLESAILKALIQKVRASIPDLNTVLKFDAITLGLTDATTYGGDVKTSHVIKGDLRAMWGNVSKLPFDGSIRISVCLGDYKNGQHVTTQRVYIPDATNRGLAYTFTSSIFVYVHPFWSGIRNNNTFVEEEVREETQARISGWIRGGCLNAPDARVNYSSDVPLTSQEFNTVQLVDALTSVSMVDADGTPCYDMIANAFCPNGTNNAFMRAFGDGQEVLGLHYIHTGTIGK